MFDSVVEILPQREQLGKQLAFLQGKQIHLLQFRKPPTAPTKVSEFLVSCKTVFTFYIKTASTAAYESATK